MEVSNEQKIRQLESALREAVYAISKSCDHCPLVMQCHGDCQRELYQYFLEHGDDFNVDKFMLTGNFRNKDGAQKYADEFVAKYLKEAD